MTTGKDFKLGGIDALHPTCNITEHVQSKILHRSLHDDPLLVDHAEGNYIYLKNGQKILDATGGAAVACLGHGNKRLAEILMRQATSVAYCHSLFFTTKPFEDLADFMIDSTYGDMSRAFFVSSGSEAMEAALKFARQFHLEKLPKEPSRVHFISRRQSYHGATLGALGVSGHTARRLLFEPLLGQHCSRVSPCFPYRTSLASREDYVAHLEAELEAEFQRVGPSNVAAFIAEPICGAGLGCVPPVEGYFQAMRRVCDRHGALLILDEIMSGCGRIGPRPTVRYPEPLHAYQDPLVGVVPDILTMGKALGAGYQPVAAMLISHRIVDILSQGSGIFVHGQTYQGHPVGCRAALEVQRIIKEDGLVPNIRRQGSLLGERLTQRLGQHPHVGDIRGMGLFWAIEFVKDRATKEPFAASAGVAMGIHELGLNPPYNICLYPGNGTADGQQGDHIILAPAYNCTKDDIDDLVESAAAAVSDFFQSIGTTW